jgi:hypothetical protein
MLSFDLKTWLHKHVLLMDNRSIPATMSEIDNGKISRLNFLAPITSIINRNHHENSRVAREDSY